MAFWGAPLPQENAVYLAAKTALEIANGAKVVSDKLKEEVGEEIKAGVGVHFGPAVVGNMGSEKHMDYTAIGDTVNTASRLESNAPGGTVYISRVVADMLGSQAKVTSLGGSIKLKGKEDSNIAIHSMLHKWNGELVAGQTLGTQKSHGCIRVPDDLADWLRHNLSKGTTVIIDDRAWSPSSIGYATLLNY